MLRSLFGISISSNKRTHVTYMINDVFGCPIVFGIIFKRNRYIFNMRLDVIFLHLNVYIPMECAFGYQH